MKVYPNLETLYLYTRYNIKTISEEQEGLSSIKFRNLTSLSLKRFKIHDGAFLLPVLLFFKQKKSNVTNIFKTEFQMIEQCPKLRSLNMCDIPSVEPTFITNLDSFLPLAINLTDVR